MGGNSPGMDSEPMTILRSKRIWNQKNTIFTYLQWFLHRFFFMEAMMTSCGVFLYIYFARAWSIFGFIRSASEMYFQKHLRIASLLGRELEVNISIKVNFHVMSRIIFFSFFLGLIKLRSDDGKMGWWEGHRKREGKCAYIHECILIYKFRNTYMHGYIHPEIRTYRNAYIKNPYIHEHIHSEIRTYTHEYIHTYTIRTYVQRERERRSIKKNGWCKWEKKTI